MAGLKLPAHPGTGAVIRLESAIDLMVVLARRCAFGDVGALSQDVATRALCEFGQRLLDLDAEDFDAIGAAETAAIPRDLLARARASRMPQTPRARPRGALASLRPAYRLLLEVIAIRWARREMAALVAALHIAGQYLPLLAFETVFGHAGDPAKIGANVAGEGSRFGDLQNPDCPHIKADRSAAERVLRVAGESGPGWRAYLDRQHSSLSHALGRCATDCKDPCSVITRLDETVAADLSDRCRLALDFRDGALVRLRHAAPVGHAFGVPSADEVLEAWDRTRTSIARRPLAAAVLADDQFPLPGLTVVFSAVAGAPLTPDTLIAAVSRQVVERIQLGVALPAR